jgi:Periplasmic binding protein
VEDKKVINDLTSCLAKLIDQKDNIPGLAQEAIDGTKHVNFDGSASQVWIRVVNRAKVERRLLDLVNAALRFTNDDPELVSIRERLLIKSKKPASFKAPDKITIKPNGPSSPNPPSRSNNKSQKSKNQLMLPIRLEWYKIIIFLISILTVLGTGINFILQNTPLLNTDLLAILPGIIIIIEAFSILMMLLFFILAIRTFSRKRRWIVTGSLVLLVVIMLVDLYFSINFLQKTQSTISSSDNPPYTGLCDGRCAVDIDRLDGLPKSLAANELKNGHLTAACAYLDLASNEDPTDAEAKIYYEDQCGGNNVTPLRCPCINYVAAIALAQEKQPSDTTYTMYTNPAIYNDSTIYNNGVSRSILQAVYLQQKDWNDAHKNGPAMYVFVANVGDVSDIQNAPQWQQNVAQQIISLQQTDKEHHIDGIVGLPSGMDTFIDQLSQIAIPMISLASLDSNDAYNYLLSVAPTTEIEMSASTHFLTKDIMKNKHGINVGIVYDDQSNTPYQSMAFAFESDLPHDWHWEEQSYGSLPQNIGPIVRKKAMFAAHHYNAIFFAGPANDLLTFITTLRQTDQTTPVLASNTTYQLAYSYLPPAARMPLQNLYFTAFAYHDTEYYTSLPKSPMINEFQKTYDPKTIHSGNIYTYQLPTSDAMLAFDAMGVFIHLIDHYGIQNMPEWQDQQAFLAHNPPAMVSGNITFTATGNTPQTKTVLLLQINPQGTNSYLDNVP